MASIDGVNIELDADDYGETIHTSEDILALLREGALDGISILTNMSVSEECARMLIEAVPEMPGLPLMAVHICLVEGRSLVEDKILPWTWKSLFLTSYRLPVRDRDGHLMRYRDTYERLRAEIRAQILCAQRLINDVMHAADAAGVPYKPQKLRIDSHQHAHLIPIVWRAMVSVIEEEHIDVEYIRTAHEPMSVFLRKRGMGWPAIGFVKNRVLANLAPRAEKWMQVHGLRPAYLWGLIMSGHMDIERIESLMPDMIRYCARRGYDLELNIHPGRMLAGEMSSEIPEESAREFYLTDNRMMEAGTARRFHEMMERIKGDT